MKAVVKTDLNLPGIKSRYTGKVRDVYFLENGCMVMVATDRISAFDVVLPEGIPCKGQVLNQLAAKFLDLTADILPNWKVAVPDPMVTIGWQCEPYKVEMVVRGYLAGHAWREYKAGRRRSRLPVFVVRPGERTGGLMEKSAKTPCRIVTKEP